MSAFSHDLTRLQTLFLLQAQGSETRSIADITDGINANPFRKAVTRQAIHRVSNRLIKSGMISKTKSRTNAAASNVKLTRKGQRALDSALSFCRYVSSS